VFEHAEYKHQGSKPIESGPTDAALSFLGFVKGFGITLIAALLCLLTLSGCGRESFMVVETNEQQQAPGNYVVPPKVDILLAQDDTGSMYESFSTINPQVVEFVRGVERENWDYHFATIPLTTDRPLTQVAGSKYDSNYGDDWVPAYPGELPWGPGTIVSQFFRRMGQYNGLIGPDEIHQTGGKEPGFETIRQALYNRVGPTNFLRQDALTVVLIVSNGDDTSKVNYCWDALRQSMIQCELAQGDYPTCPEGNLEGNQGAACGTYTESFNYYRNEFAAVKTNSASIKFYSVVAAQRSTGGSCAGGNSYRARRYTTMSAVSGGQSYEICSGQFASALSGIATNLRQQKLAMRTRYLFAKQPPNVATIRVIRYRSGNPDLAYEIPQDPVNGWTYEGKVTDVYAIDYPIPMNRSSGYAIELHGSAKLLGDDTADVQYKPAGADDSRS
jgi:hypothetical protein